MKIANKLRQIGVVLMSGLYALSIAAQAATPNPPVIMSIDGQSVVTSSGTHKFTGLPLTADGFTDIQSMITATGKYDTARIVYVSSSQGSDQTAKVYSKSSTEIGGQPLNPTGGVMPYATLSAAYAQLRNGYPDVMLLKRGDTWATSLSIAKAGKSNDERLIIGAYGSESVARPIVNSISSTSAANYSIITSNEQTNTEARNFDGAYALVEDLLFHGAGTDYQTIDWPMLQTGHSGFRRCTFDRIGIFSGWNSTIVDASTSFVEENTLYKTSPDAQGGFSHNVYLQFQLGGLNSLKNQSFESPGVAWRQRGGGLITQNLLVRDNDQSGGTSLTSLEVGETAQNISATITNNVTMHSSQGAQFANLSNTLVNGNIWTAQRISSIVIGMSLASGYSFSNVTYSNNIFWNNLGSTFSGNSYTGPVYVTGNIIRRTSGELVNNSNATFSNNKYYSGSATSGWFGSLLTYATMILTGTVTDPAPSLPDPNRNMLTYMQSLGASPSSVDEAISWYSTGVPGNSSLAGSLANRRGAWDTRFTGTNVINYVRAGFGLAALPR